MKENNFYDQLKKIKIPQFENKAHHQELKNKLLMKIQKAEAEKNAMPVKKTLLKISFSIASLAVIAVSAVSIYFAMPKYLEITKSTLIGTLYLKTDDKNDYEKINGFEKFKDNYSIKTGPDSSFTFTAGKGYLINIKENTELSIKKSLRFNRNEICKIKLAEGKADFAVDFPTKKSQFLVETDISSFAVKGTRFSVEVKDDKEVELIVREGKVWLNYNYGDLKNTDRIRETGKTIIGKINELIREEIIINENNSVIIKPDDLESLKNEINENILLAANALKLNPQDENKIVENINKIRSKKKEFLKIKNIVPEKPYEAKKDLYTAVLLTNLNMKFNEINTAVTSDEKNIFIASDANNSVLCIDAEGGIKYKFQNKDLIILTSEVSAFLSEHIFATPDFIYVLTNQGKIKIKHQIANGAEYWANAVLLKNKLYIPVSKNIYQYDGSIITAVENLSETGGQLYITGNDNKIYFNDLNGKNIKAYDIDEKKAVWESAKLKQRAFMSPLIIKNYLYIADTGGTIYKFDLNSSDVQTIAINAGIMSKLVYNNDHIYFIANDGFFYSIEPDLFKNCIKIARLDNDKNSDKFLTKKLVGSGSKIFYCAEKGRLYCYDCIKYKSDFIKITDSSSLIASPVMLNGAIYAFDYNGCCYKIMKTE